MNISIWHRFHLSLKGIFTFFLRKSKNICANSGKFYFCRPFKAKGVLYKVRSGSSVGYPEYSGMPVTHGEVFYTYILQSELDGSYYIGSTENIELRLARHNEGLSKYTLKKKPWKLVYFEVFATRSEAIIREIFLKKQRNRSFYQRLIDSWSGSSVG